MKGRARFVGYIIYYSKNFVCRMRTRMHTFQLHAALLSENLQDGVKVLVPSRSKSSLRLASVRLLWGILQKSPNS